MGIPRVKLNLRHALPLGLTLAAAVSLALAFTGLLPARLVENWYSRAAFPLISRGLASAAGLTAASMMDFLLPAAVAVAAYLLYRRRPLSVLALLSAGYLLFFWGWGVNYHRLPVESKLDFRPLRVTEQTVAALVEEAAEEINRAFLELGPGGEPAGEQALVAEADARVRAVIEALDGVPAGRWPLVVRVKTSRLLDPVFQAGGVSGMFNPFGHEALLTGGLLRPERPMVMLHEIAHVRGYADEGEANFIALLAGVHSTNPELRYSSWLSLWMYLGSPGKEHLLDPGPLDDLEAIDERIRGARVEWVSRTQGRTLDAFLKANRVNEGVDSYARIVRLAAGTRHDWGRFALP